MAGTGTSPDIPLFDLRITEDDLAAVEAALRSGRLGAGERVERFERQFADQLGARHAVAVASCTAALQLAYLAAGVGPGDEVVVPAFTMAATANAVVYCGATPVFGEIVSRERPFLDPADVERLLTPHTKAVAVVHYAGYAAAVDDLAELCAARGVALVEDAAHAPSATFGGRKLGTWGLAGAFSFFSNKVLSAGEGGLLVTDDDDVAALARSLRQEGIAATTSGGYDVVATGFDCLLDEPRAALLSSRLRRLEADVARRRELTLRYRSLLSDVDGLIVPFDEADVAGSSAYVFPVMLAEEGRQGAIARRLREQGVQTSILYAAVHRFSAYRERFPGVSLPVTELAAHTELTLPLFPHMTEQEQDRVVAVLKEALSA